MAWTQTDLDRLERAIAAGVLEVTTSDGKKVRYQSMDDLVRARDLVAGAVAPATRKPSVSYVRHRREGC